MNGVRILQLMLRQLAARYPQIPPVAADGIFGEETLEAVMIFQRDFSLPVTGVVTRTAWEAMAREVARITGAPTSPHPGYLDAPPLSEFRDGETLRALTRFLFRALSEEVENFTPPDAPGASPEENIRTLQHLSGLPVTGVLDDAAWRKLLRLFQLFVLRRGRGKK